MLVFSTHAFTEGDVLSSFFGWLYAISTHAFTEGDGVQLKRKFYWKRISTHAFTEGDISAPRVLEYECISTHAFTEGDVLLEIGILACNHFNSRLHGRRLQIQIIFAAKHFLFLLILSKFLILAFLFHLASLRFSLHPVIFPVRISLYFSVYLPFALETCTLCHNI